MSRGGDDDIDFEAVRSKLLRRKVNLDAEEPGVAFESEVIDKAGEMIPADSNYQFNA